MKCLREVLCVRDKNKLSKHERLCGGFLNSKQLVHNVGLGFPQNQFLIWLKALSARRPTTTGLNYEAASRFAI
jgi:hypothetical protein